jgi:hypothetical protein
MANPALIRVTAGMNNSAAHRSAPDAGNHVPEILHFVLPQLVKLRASGAIDQATFDAKLERLMTEELKCRKLCLFVRELPNGTTCFSVCCERTGAVWRLNVHPPEVTDLAEPHRSYDGSALEYDEPQPIADSALFFPRLSAQG